jgi:hypothetical protein
MLVNDAFELSAPERSATSGAVGVRRPADCGARLTESVESDRKGGAPCCSGVFALFCAGRWRRRGLQNTRKYIRKTFTVSNNRPVGICVLITAYLSGSSNSTAGTMLKLAAIGVINVPQ